jgi:ATP/maltotriose-dependent transcriptional regulator MalT
MRRLTLPEVYMSSTSGRAKRTFRRSLRSEALDQQKARALEAASVRPRLGERAWLEAYEAGRKLNSEQVLRLAEEAVYALDEELQHRSLGLTAREIDVLRLVADGMNNAEIAERLVLSQRTVHAHLRSIFDKLGVNSRTAAAQRSRRCSPVDGH